MFFLNKPLIIKNMRERNRFSIGKCFFMPHKYYLPGIFKKYYLPPTFKNQMLFTWDNIMFESREKRFEQTSFKSK